MAAATASLTLPAKCSIRSCLERTSQAPSANRQATLEKRSVSRAENVQGTTRDVADDDGGLPGLPGRGFFGYGSIGFRPGAQREREGSGEEAGSHREKEKEDTHRS